MRGLKGRRFNRLMWPVLLIVASASSTAGAAEELILDTAFGTGGLVTSDLRGRDRATGAALQSDGKIVVAGSSATRRSGTDFAVARYNSDGSPDRGFGRLGVVETNLSTTTGTGLMEDGAEAVLVQDDGKIVAVGSNNRANADDWALARYNSDGTLDTGFGTGGLVRTDLSSGGDDVAYAVALQSVEGAKKIVVAGYAGTGTNGSLDFAVARYHLDGTLDTAFGSPTSPGWVTIDFFGWQDVALALVVDGDGKIVLAGQAGVVPPGTSVVQADFAVARLTPEGMPDEPFGTAGKVVTQLSEGYDGANAVVVQTDGRGVQTVLAGGCAGGDFAMVRYDQVGGLDPGFGDGGKVSTDFGVHGACINGLALQGAENQWIVAVGGAGGRFAVARYGLTGVFDRMSVTDFNPASTEVCCHGAADVVVQGDDKIVVVGTVPGRRNDDFGLARYLQPAA